MREPERCYNSYKGSFGLQISIPHLTESVHIALFRSPLHSCRLEAFSLLLVLQVNFYPCRVGKQPSQRQPRIT